LTRVVCFRALARELGAQDVNLSLQLVGGAFGHFDAVSEP
jgi:hypothetical protein